MQKPRSNSATSFNPMQKSHSRRPSDTSDVSNQQNSGLISGIKTMIGNTIGNPFSYFSGGSKFEFNFVLDEQEFVNDPNIRIIYKICAMKMLLHECYVILEQQSSLNCIVDRTPFTELYKEHIVQPLFNIISKYDEEYANKYKDKYDVVPDSVEFFNTNMGELIRDFQHFILFHDGYVDAILAIIDKLEPAFIDLYNYVLQTCGNHTIMKLRSKDSSLVTIAQMLFFSKKLLYYFSQLHLTSKHKLACVVDDTFQKYIDLLKVINSNVQDDKIFDLDGFVRFNVQFFNTTYQGVDAFTLTDESVQEFLQKFHSLSESGKQLLECLEKVTPFEYKSDDESDDEHEYDENQREPKLQQFKDEIKQLSKDIYRNYDILLKQLSERGDDEESIHMQETLRNVIHVDRIFNDDFDRMIDDIKDMFVGENEDLDIELYKLREKFFYLQLGVYRDAIPEPPPRRPGHRPGPSGHSYPNITEIIRLFNNKADKLTKMQQYFRSERFTRYPAHENKEDDVDEHTGDENIGESNVRTSRATSKHKGRASNARSKGSSMQPSFKINAENHIEMSNNDKDVDSVLKENIENLTLDDYEFDLGKDFDEFLKHAEDQFGFGGVIEESIAQNIEKVNFTSKEHEDCMNSAKVIFKNLTFIFEKTSTLFCNDNVLKLCSLFILPKLSKKFSTYNEYLFVNLTATDTDLCTALKIKDLSEYISNDTTIRKINTETSTGNCIFLFRYISILYNYFLSEALLENLFTRTFNRNKDLLYYIIILLKKFTYKIAHLHEFIKDS